MFAINSHLAETLEPYVCIESRSHGTIYRVQCFLLCKANKYSICFMLYTVLHGRAAHKSYVLYLSGLRTEDKLWLLSCTFLRIWRYLLNICAVFSVYTAINMYLGSSGPLEYHPRNMTLYEKVVVNANIVKDTASCMTRGL